MCLDALLVEIPLGLGSHGQRDVIHGVALPRRGHHDFFQRAVLGQRRQTPALARRDYERRTQLQCGP